MTVAEDTVIGMILNEQGNLEQALAAGLKLDHFADSFCRRAFQAILKAEAEGLGTTIRAVATLLPDEDTVLERLSSGAPIAQNISFYVQEIRNERWLEKTQRQLQDVHSRLLNRKPYEKIETLKLQVSALVESATEEGDKRTFATSELAQGVFLETEARIAAARENKVVGIPTGIRSLDRLVYGWEKGRLYILGARSRVGKTTAALNFAATAGKAGFRSAFFTVEMAASEIAKKLASHVGKIDFSKMMSGAMSAAELEKLRLSTVAMADLPIVFNEAGPSFEAFAFELRRLKRTRNIQFAIFDYVQQLFLSDKRGVSRNQDLAAVTSGMKWLARELDIPILALAQLNRDADSEEGAPSLKNLADSSSLEKDSDVVMFLWRQEKGFDRNGEKIFDYWLDIAKQRNGMEGRISLQADLARNYFSEA